MMIATRKELIGELIRAARLGRRGFAGCLSNEWPQAGDEHRLHEAHPPAGPSALIDRSARERSLLLRTARPRETQRGQPGPRGMVEYFVRQKDRTVMGGL